MTFCLSNLYVENSSFQNINLYKMNHYIVLYNFFVMLQI